MKRTLLRRFIAIGSFGLVSILMAVLMFAHSLSAAPILAAPYAQATAAPEEPTTAPEEPTAAPEEPTAAPEEPTAAPPTPIPTAIPQPQAAATATSEPPTITPEPPAATPDPPTVTPAVEPATAVPAAPRPARLPTTADDGHNSSAWLIIMAMLLCLAAVLLAIARKVRR